MAQSMTELNDRLRVSWPVLLALILLTVSAVGAYWSTRAMAEQHCADNDRHHGTAELRQEFITRDAMSGVERTLTSMDARLQRIEGKLDDHVGRGGE